MEKEKEDDEVEEICLPPRTDDERPSRSGRQQQQQQQPCSHRSKSRSRSSSKSRNRGRGSRIRRPRSEGDRADEDEEKRIEEEEDRRMGARIASLARGQGTGGMRLRESLSFILRDRASEAITGAGNGGGRGRGREGGMHHSSSAASLSGEEADTLSFCWMPAIEEFVAREGERRRRRSSGRRKERRSNQVEEEGKEGKEEEKEEEEEGEEGELPRKSYHATLLSDRTYHNPHALEGMAAVYGLLPARRQHR
ncbi:hypothetical protein VYU27_008555 [Nannochloropsis oceanica]